MPKHLFSKGRAGQTRAVFAIFAGAFLAACSDTSGILGTDVGRQMVNSNAPTPELILRDAVFIQVKEQDAQQAVKTLEDDGAVCRGAVCSWSFLDREPWFDTWGVRMPGPRRTSEKTWFIAFVSDQILSESNIETHVEAELVR